MNTSQELRKKEHFENTLECLSYDERRTLYFIYAASDKSGLLMYTDKKSVTSLVRKAINAPQSVVYDCIARLEELQLIEKMNPQKPEWAPRNRGFCLQILHAKATYNHVALAILKYPPGARSWLLYDPVYRARDWMPGTPITW